MKYELQAVIQNQAKGLEEKLKQQATKDTTPVKQESKKASHHANFKALCLFANS